MRFVWGPVPASETLDPLAAGWTPLTPMTPGRFTTHALLVGLPFTLTMAVLLTGGPGGLRGLFRYHPREAVAFLLAVPLAVPVHELVHALAYGQGLRDLTLVAGFCTRGKCPYVLLDAPRPRGRVLLVLVAPFVALSLLPLAAVLFLAPTGRLVTAFCCLHAALCGGDAVVVGRLVSQLPRGALVHNGGWQTYWSRDG